MKKLSLLIVDKDEEYLAALTAYLTTNYFSEFMITSISNEGYLKEYLDSAQGIDIVLINRDFYDSTIENKFINTVIIFGEEHSIKNEDYYIFKYKEANKIYNDIKSFYILNNPNITEEINGGSRDTKIISCYSPIGGVGKSLISIGTLMKLRESSKEVLYLNFEDVPVTSVFFKCSTKRSMSDLLYLAKDRDKNLKNALNSYMNKDTNGIYYFNPIESVLDYETITREDVIYLLNSIKGLNKFDVVIIDMCSKFDSLYAGLLGISDNILAILGTDMQGKAKMDIFLKQQESLDKFIFIINRYKNLDEMSMIPEALKYEQKPITARIEYYEVMDGSINGMDILMSKNPFTSGIEQVASKLLSEEEFI